MSETKPVAIGATTQAGTVATKTSAPAAVKQETGASQQPVGSPATGKPSEDKAGGAVAGLPLAEVHRAVELYQSNSCLRNLKPGEPFFVLRGQDIYSATVVRRWAELARDGGVDTVKYLDAVRVASAMDQWPTKKRPD
jgi:hypothetical protein